MRRVCTLCLSVFLFLNATAQSNNGGDTLPTTEVPETGMQVFTKVEVEATFPGGDVDWREYLMNSINADIPVLNGANAGTYNVIVRFIVNKEGVISDVVAETRNGFGMEQEAIRVIKNGPKWNPAIQNNRPVNAYRRQPFTFMVVEKETRKEKRMRKKKDHDS